MGQYNLMFEQEEFTELVRLYSELAKIADRQMNEYQMLYVPGMISQQKPIKKKLRLFLLKEIKPRWQASNKDYSSKTVVFKLKITSVNKLTRNKITDKWVKDNYYEERGISTVKEYNEWILEYIKEEIIKPELWQKALEKVNLKAIPSKLQQEVIDSMNGDAEAQAEYESLSLDEYKKREGLDDKTMQENYKTELKSELLMWQLVKDLKLTASNDEIEEQYENSYADANLDSVEEMKKLYTKEEIKEVVLLDKAQNYISKMQKLNILIK